MLSRFMRRFALPTLLLALTAAGCERSADLAGPATLEVPVASEGRGKPAPTSSGELVRIAPGAAESVSQVIDHRGGELKVGGHMITVPPRAVLEPTLFTMTAEGDGYLSVDLLATRVNPQGDTVDVGRLGFLKPVTLKMDYQAAETSTSPERLKIFWLVDGTADGRTVAQKTIIDQSSKWLIAHLKHFSKYAIGT